LKKTLAMVTASVTEEQYAKQRGQALLPYLELIAVEFLILAGKTFSPGRPSKLEKLSG